MVLAGCEPNWEGPKTGWDGCQTNREGPQTGQEGHVSGRDDLKTGCEGAETGWGDPKTDQEGSKPGWDAPETGWQGTETQAYPLQQNSKNCCHNRPLLLFNCSPLLPGHTGSHMFNNTLFSNAYAIINIKYQFTMTSPISEFRNFEWRSS